MTLPLRRLADWAVRPLLRSEARAREERLRRQHEALVTLATDDALRAGDVEAAIRRLTEVAALTLGVQRASVWWMVDRTRIVCADLFEQDAARHTRGAELGAATFPSYFAALHENRVIAAHDAHADPRTSEFSAAYLTPLGIGAMLDAPIRRAGELIGVVCHEHVGGPRHWSEEDQHFAGAIADSVAIALEAATRRDAESALRQHETLFRVLIENASDIVAVLGADGTTRYVSPSVTRILGYEADGLVGRSVFTLVHADDVARTRAMVREGPPGETGPPHRCRIRHADGTWRVLEVLARNASSDPVINGVVLNARDVTQLVGLEDSLRRSEVLSAMGSLVAGVAHEVRNPLFGMTATLDAFEALHPLDQESREHIGILRRQLDRLSRLMRDLLEFGRPRQLQRAHHHVVDLFGRAEDACRGDPAGGTVEIEYRLESPLPPVFVDVARMAQALGNLMQNALEHSPAGSAVVVAASPARAHDRAGVSITVEDAGPGFRPEELALVFEPFYSRRAGGTGLGLPIVRRIVEEHGGTVAAENRREGGGRVRLWLPAAPENTAPAVPAA